IVEAQVEDGVHHARHRGARARAHRHQQRVLGVAEFRTDDFFDAPERVFDVAAQRIGVLAAVGVEIRAHFGGDGEAGRHRNAQIGHLGQARAFAAEEIFHLRVAVGLSPAEEVHELLRHLSSAPYPRLSCLKSAMPRNNSLMPDKSASRLFLMRSSLSMTKTFSKNASTGALNSVRMRSASSYSRASVFVAARLRMA